jgi:hypothetical protein
MIKLYVFDVMLDLKYYYNIKKYIRIINNIVDEFEKNILNLNKIQILLSLVNDH